MLKCIKWTSSELIDSKKQSKKKQICFFMVSVVSFLAAEIHGVIFIDIW